MTHEDLYLRAAYLKVPLGKWDVGTLGTVVEVFDGGVMFEVADEQGRTLEILDVPFDCLRPMKRSARQPA